MLNLCKIVYRERERERDVRTDGRTDRQTQTQTETQTDRQTDRQTRTNAISFVFSNSYIYHRHHQRERTECEARDTTSDSGVHLQHGRKRRCSTFIRHQENGDAATVCRHHFWLHLGDVQFYTAGLP